MQNSTQAQKPKDKFITDTTLFKLVVYFSHKRSGVAYTQLEIDANKNRKYIETFDFIYTKEGKTLTRHDLALQKLRDFYAEYNQVIMRSVLFVNDKAEKKQFRIGEFYKNKALNIYVPPKFITCEDTKQVFYNGLLGEPLRTYDLIHKVIPLKHYDSSVVTLK